MWYEGDGSIQNTDCNKKQTKTKTKNKTKQNKQTLQQTKKQTKLCIQKNRIFENIFSINSILPFYIS